ELGLTRMEIDGLDLFDHDESLHLWVIGDCYMERVAPVRLGQGTYNGKAGLFVEEGVAYDECRTTPFLLVTRLRVKGDGDKVPLFRNIRLHLPDLPPDRRAPIRFRCLV